MDPLAANKALVSQFWQEVYEGRNYDRIGDFFAPDGEYVDVAMPDSVARGPAAVGFGPAQES
jgi:hypothetical protein